MDEGDLPHDTRHIADIEVCKLIVALTRLGSSATSCTRNDGRRKQEAVAVSRLDSSRTKGTYGREQPLLVRLQMVSFSRGALYQMLGNPVYVGGIRHKRTIHTGQHDPIIERTTWDRVQEVLKNPATRQRGNSGQKSQALLISTLFDENSAPLRIPWASSLSFRLENAFAQDELIAAAGCRPQQLPDVPSAVRHSPVLRLHWAAFMSMRRPAPSSERTADVFRVYMQPVVPRWGSLRTTL